MASEGEKKELKVREIMSCPCVTEDEGALVTQIVKDMAEMEIGSVVITSGRQPVGIVTERDIALKVLLQNKQADEVKAKEIMSSPLVSIDPATTVDEASKLLAKKHLKRLPVVEDGTLLGIVSIRNILTLKPEYVKRFYPRARLLASGWTLDRLERALSACEESLMRKSLRSFNEALKAVYDELAELVGYYVDDKELRDIFESIAQFYHQVEGQELSIEEQRRRLDEILRKFRHITFARKQQSFSSFASISRWGDHRSRGARELRLPFKRTRP
jgi:signal-transduction protein with cAMP-binding, CBS, and nucleotidyltransferase domain